jgi:hypothetical protein
VIHPSAVCRGVESGEGFANERGGAGVAALIRALGQIDAEAGPDDLQVRVIEAVECGTSQREAAESFNLSRSSAVKWLHAGIEAPALSRPAEHRVEQPAGSLDLVASQRTLAQNPCASQPLANNNASIFSGAQATRKLQRNPL